MTQFVHLTNISTEANCQAEPLTTDTSPFAQNLSRYSTTMALLFSKLDDMFLSKRKLNFLEGHCRYPPFQSVTFDISFDIHRTNTEHQAGGNFADNRLATTRAHRQSQSVRCFA